MSDAQAAQVTQNGVPPTTQDKVEETPGFKVFVGNLAYSIKDEGLKAFFSDFSDDLTSASVIMRGTRSAGYGFAAFETEEAANKAVEALNKKDLEGRPVIVEIAKPADQKDKERKDRRFKRRPGRRRGKAVPGEVTEAEANGEASKPDDVSGNEGATKPKKKKKKPARKPKTAASSTGDAEGAPAVNGTGEGAAAETTQAPRKFRRRFRSRPPRPAGQDPVGEPSKTMLFVANLGFNVDDAGLSALFTEAGFNVVSARVVRKRWNPKRSKGYGFVEVDSEEQQKKAIEALNGKDVGGRSIAVKVAVNTTADDASDDANPAADASPAATPAPTVTVAA
jgi:RNA recognition motif-containing protein